jgi:hypothetical protein
MGFAALNAAEPISGQQTASATRTPVVPAARWIAMRIPRVDAELAQDQCERSKPALRSSKKVIGTRASSRRRQAFKGSNQDEMAFRSHCSVGDGDGVLPADTSIATKGR